ncbi:hypothetical protein [Arcobacter sp. FWKO B]|uniref:hypothetical protein n=1 Tax=Arcobacter sp. FWKO B TaxID=2593672 RepID=UPI0018A63C45|nr:hypothetical protein [Arcobacter sp. FWKO B]QOG12616.1 hypothetical protein FWKOB_07845 [Arcobacter sp. FWKO B]
MKVLQLLKKRVFITLFFLFSTCLFGATPTTNPYILTDDLLDIRAASKIYEIGSEVKAKLGVNLYIYAKENYGMDIDIPTEEKIKRIKEIEDELIKDLKKPYAILTLSVDQVHVNLLMSDDLNSILNKNEILNNYVVPLLASKDKNTLYAKVSAALLNGYAEIGDRLAKSRGIELESSIGSAGYTAGTIWKMIMYTLVLGGIVLYTYAILRQRKYKQ